MLIPIHLHVCDFSEPVKHSLLQPPLIVVVCNFIELIGLWLHSPSVVEHMDHLVEIPAFDNWVDFLDGRFVPHTFAEGFDGVILEGLPYLEESFIVVFHLEFPLERSDTWQFMVGFTPHSEVRQTLIVVSISKYFQLKSYLIDSIWSSRFWSCLFFCIVHLFIIKACITRFITDILWNSKH